MSLLMFAQTDEEIWVLTDTLAADSDGAPAFYTDKCLPVPRMRMLIAGTGTHNIVFEWFKFVERHGPIPGTTTIYHFGVLRDGRLGRRPRGSWPNSMTTSTSGSA
jgi:hypothetical protein